MLGSFLICLFIGSCHSKFDVSVSVLEPFCLNKYYEPEIRYAHPQLQLEFYVVFGDKRSSSYYFQTKFEDYYDNPPHFKFVNDVNIISSSVRRPLVLGTPIPLPAVSPYDSLDIRFYINPVWRWSESSEIHEKCSSDERLHNQTVVPRSILQSKANHDATSQFTIDLSHTPCLNSTEHWFHNYKSQISIQVLFDCHGPCKDLFTTTTSTTPTTGLTTIASTSTSSTTTTTMKTPRTGSNKLIIPLVIVIVVSVLQSAFIIGYCIHLKVKGKINSPMQNKIDLEPSIYYDTMRANNTLDQDTEAGNYAEADDDDHAQYAREVIISQPLHNGPSN